MASMEILHSLLLSFGLVGCKRLFGRLRIKGEDKMRMHLREIGKEGVNWIYLAQDRDR
jgi:hypothetical protein